MAILLKEIFKTLLDEALTFKQLMGMSDRGRIDRSNNVMVRSTKVNSYNGDEAWEFSYKSPKTDGSNSPKERHHGYIKFFKTNVDPNDRASDIPCSVFCTCNDYKYMWDYNNSKEGSSEIQGDDDFKYTFKVPHNGNAPRRKEVGGTGNFKPGLCKHLLALSSYLKTKLEPTAPDLDNPDLDKTDKTQSTYSDSRTDSLQETVQDIRSRINNFVINNPEFDIDSGENAPVMEGSEFHISNKEYNIYKGFSSITVSFPDGNTLTFDIHFRNNMGKDKEPWKDKAASKLKSIASRIQKEVVFNAGGNSSQKSWKDAFKEALNNPEMKQFVRENDKLSGGKK